MKLTKRGVLVADVFWTVVMAGLVVAAFVWEATL